MRPLQYYTANIIFFAFSLNAVNLQQVCIIIVSLSKNTHHLSMMSIPAGPKLDLIEATEVSRRHEFLVANIGRLSRNIVCGV
jgi:hypothetical protein